MKGRRLSAVLIFLWSSVFVLCPLIYVIVLSFMQRGANGNVVYSFTLGNYARMLDKTYFAIFSRSLLIAFATTVTTVLVGYPFGYFLAGTSKKRRAFMIMLVMIPFWTNSLLRLSGWVIILQSTGIINTLLKTLGIIDESIRLMNNQVSVLLTTVYMLLPFMILPVFNAVDKLDKSLLEASADLGIGRVKTFLKITLPLTLPGIISGATLVFIPSVGLFFISDIIGDGKTMLIGNLIQNQFQKSLNWSFGAAVSVVMIVGVLIFVALMFKSSGNKEGGIINL